MLPDHCLKKLPKTGKNKFWRTRVNLCLFFKGEDRTYFIELLCFVQKLRHRDSLANNSPKGSSLQQLASGSRRWCTYLWRTLPHFLALFVVVIVVVVVVVVRNFLTRQFFEGWPISLKTANRKGKNQLNDISIRPTKKDVIKTVRI